MEFKENDFLQIVSQTKADIKPFIHFAIKDSSFRESLVGHLLANPAINIYYHSFCILNEATKLDPASFYNNWVQFASLLQHPNSYHRNYGMELIANLSPVDCEDRFNAILADFYQQLQHEKVSTAKYCISQSAPILKAKPKLINQVTENIIQALRFSSRPEKHQNFLLSAFIELISESINENWDKTLTVEFLMAVRDKTTSSKIKKEIQALF